MAPRYGLLRAGGLGLLLCVVAMPFMLDATATNLSQEPSTPSTIAARQNSPAQALPTHSALTHPSTGAAKTATALHLWGARVGHGMLTGLVSAELVIGKDLDTGSTGTALVACQGLEALVAKDRKATHAPVLSIELDVGKALTYYYAGASSCIGAIVDGSHADGAALSQYFGVANGFLGKAELALEGAGVPR